jgi:hypothetical protein
MLAVVHALRVWRCYLKGAEFTMYTDHVSNTYFQTQPNLLRRQARWSERPQRFGCNVGRDAARLLDVCKNHE